MPLSLQIVCFLISHSHYGGVHHQCINVWLLFHTPCHGHFVLHNQSKISYLYKNHWYFIYGIFTRSTKISKKIDHVTVVTFSPPVLPKRPTRGSPSYIYRPTYITGNLNILVRFSIFRNLLRIKALNLEVRKVYLFSIACAHSNQGLHEIYKVWSN